MKKNILSIYLLASCLLLNACETFVSIPNPSDQFEEEMVFTSNHSATSVIMGIYGEMIISGASPYNLALITGLIGDGLAFPANSDQAEFYNHSIDCRTNTYLIDYWDAAYRYIHRANVTLENCGASSPLSENVKKQLRGEALFIRAYWYLHLVNLFGDIPLPTSSDYTANASLNRTSTGQVYAQVIQDLVDALQVISDDYVNESNIPGSAERIRPNRGAVLALLARAYLYSGKFSEAANTASELINNPAYRLESPEQAFLSRSKEAIWQLALPTPNLTSINTQDGAHFILENTPGNSAQTALSNETVAAFEDGDLRRNSWIGVYLDTAALHPVPYYYAYKYKVKRSQETKEYTMMLRLAEQYLIRAEARAQSGKYTEALQDLNVIRNRAGVYLLNAANTALSRSNVLQLVIKERQRELFNEHGHRWFDLKRMGACDTLMTSVAKDRNIDWKPEHKLLPLPQTEIALKPYIQQNPGY